MLKPTMPRVLDGSAIVRGLCVIWAFTMIGFMAIGSFSPARIGTMTWGPTHDIWAATIAISQINFGLSGGLGYKEVEQAITNEVTGTKNVMDIGDAKTISLLNDPAAVTRGIRAGAAVRKSDLSIPKSKLLYVSDWAEDLGYADFYNVAFRLFGFNSYSTHWLYISLLAMSSAIFSVTFRRGNVALAVLTLGVTALFLLSSSTIFSSRMPSFAANRFVSTLAVIPLLHLVCMSLRKQPFARRTWAAFIGQSLIMMFAIMARSSAQWCVVAVLGSTIAIILIRIPQINVRHFTPLTRKIKLIFRENKAISNPITVTAALIFVSLISRIIYNISTDDRYFMEDNFPHHLFWHSAYIGLTVNPKWPEYKPFPEVSNSGDGAGFLVFEHVLKARGEPYIATNPGLYGAFYRVRLYEKFIRDQYIDFIKKNPKYAYDLFVTYKTRTLRFLIGSYLVSIRHTSALLACFSVALSSIALLMNYRPIKHLEMTLSFGILWVCSLLPVYWAYPSDHLLADQIWSTLFFALSITSVIGATAARAVSSIASRFVPQSRVERP